ncbi:hypothetical protein [Bosea thiooxidans]|uniref:hypothetical protein n=1 Tax=Bosea thiooxidans TaxID=53254 RepID=UPI0009A5D3C1|nr:hypothetical protein [Bosea thiooxidans]
MVYAKDLPSNFRHVRLLLARQKGHPPDEEHQGYDLLVPLDNQSRLDPVEWKKHEAACRVRRFNEHEEARIGRLRRKPGGQWFFDYEAEESDDEVGFHLGEERFVTGEYISVGNRANHRVYRVVRVEKP